MGVIVWAQARRAVVHAARRERRRVKGVHRRAIGRGEGDVGALARPLIVADPEEGLAVLAEADRGAAGLGRG